MQVRCIGCGGKFDLMLENFSDHEIIFCPVCGLDHEILKRTNRVIAEQIA